MTCDDALEFGSKNVAKPSPICKPTSVPAISTAVNTTCIVKPSAAPIRNCMTKIHTPAEEKTVTCGIARSVGATMSVMKASQADFHAHGQRRVTEHRRSCDQRERCA